LRWSPERQARLSAGHDDLGGSVELLRPRNGLHQVPAEPDSPDSVQDVWVPAARMAAVGTFVLLLVAALYFCRPVLLPVVAALVIGTTLGPIVKHAARHGVSPWVPAIVLGSGLLAVVGAAVTLLAAPVGDWMAKAPEVGSLIREKLYILDRPLAALRELQAKLMPEASDAVVVEQSKLGIVSPVITYVTPAAAQLTLFFVTLIFFLASHLEFRRYLASFFANREAKLRFIRISSDIEQQLASYVAVVTLINLGLGIVVAAGAWLFGFPNPILFGFLAAMLNYIPYLGAACMTLILFGVGLITFPSLGYALLPPATFVAVATIEGQFITPMVLGRHLTLNPLAILLSLAFWAWIWGPIGAFLAVPLTVMALVTLHHLFPPEESRLPG
jgi:predicted PurR-regulated permease PerM